ncbi:hypothetical protein HPB50_016164 [Hyalomma asiaticum]|uniref:Uncharacterized protein n=1 Tax=Hyalomma asiaticum TaxID=266040 RepID=A0ACB7TH98_HYAAI|nr:hypothetical protein HPB50_016164 [Hyalomma asiaticum]
MDKAAERRARRAAAARARRSDPAVRAREAEASRYSARRRREDPAVRALTLLTSFIENIIWGTCIELVAPLRGKERNEVAWYVQQPPLHEPSRVTLVEELSNVGA